MDTQKFKYGHAVYIGRFEPFHNGHAAVIRQAAQQAEHLIILIGSAFEPRTTKNPWNAAERAAMIRATFPELEGRMTIFPLRDTLYCEDEWVAKVQRLVDGACEKYRQGQQDKNGIGDGQPQNQTQDKSPATNRKTMIIGMDKDASSYYLRSFPQWDFVPAQEVDVLSATDLRHYLFEADQTDCHGALLMIRANVPKSVYGMLEAFRKSSPDYPRLVDEHTFIQAYRKPWEAAPYPPIHVTADAVVIHSGHILLVERGAKPGKGLWALPGGFVGQGETVFDAAIRELYEETAIKLPERLLRSTKPDSHVFDHPGRSLRGRTVTHAFCFRFPSGPLPKIKGGDDATKAAWLPIHQVMANSGTLFEDHWHIIRHFCPAEIHHLHEEREL